MVAFYTHTEVKSLEKGIDSCFICYVFVIIILLCYYVIIIIIIIIILLLLLLLLKNSKVGNNVNDFNKTKIVKLDYHFCVL